ncbi:hypothetical protein [Chitinimonas sp.]|uniref:hypothetical protein n=1 Tax=Chitinimonas sp. TaxID=1934313 RepID=UPI0035B30B21
MSLSFASSLGGELVMVIGADSLSVIELSGWNKQRIAEFRLPLKVHEGVPQFDGLNDWLAARRARRLSVRISSSWIRFAVLPWQAELIDDTLSLALAQALFAEQYGEASASWKIDLTPCRPGEARIASAVDARWFAALEALAKHHTMQLRSVQPLLAAIYNGLADKVPDEALLAVVEPRRLVLIHIENGQWRQLYNRVLPEPWERRLPSLITQASASLNALSTPVFIAAPLFERGDLGRLSATWLRLPARRGFDPRRDRDWAFCQGC